MAEKKKLNRTNQCQNCPWKKSTNPYDIPDGYSVKKHKDLERTIATPGYLNVLNSGKINLMACHHSEEDNEEICIGWLHHQLGVGNNIPLRVKMLSYENAKDYKIFGEQHVCFEDTLPS